MHSAPVVLARHLMGTRFELVLPGDARPERLRAAGEEALDEIERLDTQLSLYRPDSDIAALNARASQTWVPLEPRLFALILQMRDLSAVTGGAFDPTVLPLLRAWGFIGASGHIADPEEVDQARRITGFGHVLLDPERRCVRFDAPGVALDLGAIGKGYAVESAVEILREAGIPAALLHGGTSTVAAIGTAPDGQAWKVAIADPASPENHLATVALADGDSLSVSGVHGKAFVGPDGRTYGHVLDPRRGEPVMGARLSAVVLPSPTEADALSTALLVLGAEGLDLFAARWPEASALIVAADGALIRRGDAFV